MADVFYSSRLTLVHAQQHIQNFNVLVNDFVDGQPWAQVTETDSDTGEHIHKIKFTRQLPQMLPCILFDIANSLRATLDQAGYASALASGSTKLEKTNFPFADSLINLNNNIDGPRNVCRDLPQTVTALFRGFKPYKGGNDPLWALNKLCNTKKHCSLVPLGIERTMILYRTATIGNSVEGLSLANDSRRWNSEKNEITLFKAPPGMTPKVDAEVTFNIAIDGIDTIAGEQVAHVLHSMSGIVERILLATEAECRRLGFQID
jgi:hypothetical protein